MQINISHIITILFCALTVIPQKTAAQQYQKQKGSKDKITISGYITDSENKAIELANIYEYLTLKGTSSNEKGYYKISLPKSDTIILQFSCLSYKKETRIIPVKRDSMEVNVKMAFANKKLSEIVIEKRQHRYNSFEKLDAKNVRMLPDASGGSIEALLVTFAGVNSNNEMSSQYSVRGGNFDENLVYVNGTEVYRPLLIRSGQQEGLSFINPDMVKSVKFSAGGFEAKYGDKMSSVLDIEYKKPEKLEASASASLLGASAFIGQESKNKKFTQIHGIRYKTNRYLLGTLDTEGEYNPSFADYQTYLTYSFNKKTEIDFLGNLSNNTYNFAPETRETKFGTYSNAYNLKMYFDGEEKDLFKTAFGALSLKYKTEKNTKLKIQASLFKTIEKETYDIRSEYWLSETAGKNDNSDVLGTGGSMSHARNNLEATVLNIGHSGNHKTGQNSIEWGINYKREEISDDIKEWELQDSSGYIIPYSDSKIIMKSSVKSKTDINNNKIEAYIQDTWKFRTNEGLYTLNGGIRYGYSDINDETLISPRLSVSLKPSWEKDFIFRLSAGVYYQSLFYKELRDTATINGITKIRINKNIKSPKSYQIVAGSDYNFFWLNKSFKLTTEAYYKKIKNLIPYYVDNVKVVYLGKNIGDGYTTGIDMKLYGELIPETDSWISLSFMNSKEKTDTYTVSRPNEQRYKFAMFFQDYFPNKPEFRMTLRFIWADGLPFGPNSKSRKYATYRMPAYRRVDIGFARVFSAKTDKFMTKNAFKYVKNIYLGFDCFNLLDIKNTNSYYWVTDIKGAQWAVPNYLTSRLINFKLAADF